VRKGASFWQLKFGALPWSFSAVTIHHTVNLPLGTKILCHPFSSSAEWLLLNVEPQENSTT